ncbi:MAG: hypothetical protein JJU00_02050 [Opitutales bacterium]|nr:hypothetical protein [Opitutales bacterium]
MWAWGANDRGQLGLDTPYYVSPEPVGASGTDWKAVSAGAGFSLAIDGQNRLWGWGRNQEGTLGDGTTTDRPTPVPVDGDSTWISVSARSDFAVGIKTDGSLWAWGRNNNGRVGDGTTGGLRTSPVPVVLPDEAEIAFGSVSSGEWHTLAIATDGSLWAWGRNNVGQLGDDSGSDQNTAVMVDSGEGNPWTAVSAGHSHSAAIREDGSLWTWGAGSSGRLGHGSISNITVPTQVEGEGWNSVAAGNSHTLALREGVLWAWGSNFSHVFGDGTNTSSNVPVEVGGEWEFVAAGVVHSAGIDTDGRLWLWGNNDYGQLGDGSATMSASPVEVAGSGNWKAVALEGTGSFGRHTVALSGDGTLMAWGSAFKGQVGTGAYGTYTEPTGLENGEWETVVAVSNSSYGIQSDGTLWSWGQNTFGQLGHGTNEDVFFPSPVGEDSDWAVVTAGQYHTVAIKDDGRLYAWGRNTQGQLGNGEPTDPRTVPGQVGGDNDWAAASAGRDFTLALKQDGTLWAWGFNSSGQLGVGSTNQSYSPIQVLLAEGEGSNSDWVEVSAGADHSVARRGDGTIWAWGSNANGRLGDGTTDNSSVPIQVGDKTNWAAITAGDAQTLAVDEAGELWAWGSASWGVLGTGDFSGNILEPKRVGEDSDWVAVQTGLRHTLAVKWDGSLWAWGWSTSGQVGDGSTSFRATPQLIDDSGAWSSVSAASFLGEHSLAIRSAPLSIYNVSVLASPPESGSFFGGGDYHAGSLATVEANAEDGFEFIHWTENDSVVSTDLNYSFTVEGDRELVAVFGEETSGPQTRHWKDPVDGSFNTVGNWATGVPLAEDSAVFDVDGTYAIDFSDDVTTDSLSIGHNRVSFNLYTDPNDGGDIDRHTYSVAGVTGLHVGYEASQNAELTINRGVVHTPVLDIGTNSSNASAEVNLINGAEMSATQGPSNIGAQGEGGSLTVAGGSRLDTASSVVRIGDASGTEGIVTISGDDSIWQSEGMVDVGIFGAGTLKVEDGATVTVDRARIAREETSNSSVTITDESSLWDIAESLYVGGDADEAGGEGTLNIEQNGTVRVGDTLQIWEEGTVNLDGGLIRFDGYENQGTFNFLSGMIALGGDRMIGGAGGDAVIEEHFGPAPDLGEGFGLTVEGDADLRASFRVADGELKVGGTLDVDAGSGSLALDGGTIRTGGFFNDGIPYEGHFLLMEEGNFDFHDGRLIVDGGSVGFGGSESVVLDGRTPDDNPQLILRNGSRIPTGSHDRLVIGAENRAEMRVEGGSRVWSREGWIGFQDGSEGVVVVTGVDDEGNPSEWNVQDSQFGLSVGGGRESDGGTGLLKIDNHGRVLNVSEGPNSILKGGTVVISNDGVLEVGRGMNVHGDVTIKDDGVLEVMDIFMSIVLVMPGGGVTLKRGGSIDLTGGSRDFGVEVRGGVFSTDDDVVVGDGSEGLLFVNSGGRAMTEKNGYIARQPGSDGVATITGTDGGEPSLWCIAGSLYIGGSEEGEGGPARLEIADGARVEVGSGVINHETGELELSGGTLQLDAGGCPAPEEPAAPMTLAAQSAGVLENHGTISGQGTIDGSIVNEGVFKTGSGPAGMIVNGSFVQGAASQLEVVLDDEGGDRLETSASMDLGGTLTVELADGFEPASQQNFIVLRADGGIEGEFDHVLVDGSPAEPEWGVEYGANTVVLVAPSVSVTMAGWLGDHFSAEQLADESVGGFSGDPTGAGVPNALAYLLGMDPWAPDLSRLPDAALVTSGDAGEPERVLAIEFERRIHAAGVEVGYVFSENLDDWSEAFVEEEVLNSDGEFETVRVRLVSPAVDDTGQGFLQIRIEETVRTKRIQRY